jgi:hypothetical protein
MLNKKLVCGILLYGSPDSLPVLAAENESPQDQQVQRALE